MGVPQRPGYQRISQSAKGNLMQIKGAEASAKLGATAHQNTWQRWSHGQFNYRSGSRTARYFRKHARGRKVRCRIRSRTTRPRAANVAVGVELGNLAVSRKLHSLRSIPGATRLSDPPSRMVEQHAADAPGETTW